ncbi:kinesin motor domain protein [Cooperia oncophora]
MGDDIPVKVFVRARPFSDKEKLENARECLQIFVESNQITCNGRAFTFDGVLDPSTPQDTAYDVTTSFLLEQFFKGFNCTVLAYGQTGSGKTFTMGTEETTASMKSETRGIIPRLVDAIFRQIGEAGLEMCFRVLVSMLEIYDEKVHDLLCGGREPLQVREQDGHVFVQGLSKNQVHNLKETMAQLEKGGSLRSKGQTAMNAQSSRSHAIFTISLEKTAAGEEDTGFTAKLHLVDLAGSERLKKTQAEGTRKMEGIRINEDSLGGNSYTVMIACVSPADSNAEETLSTLRYADRAKKIKNKPVVNIDAGQQKILELKEKVATLERQLAEARMGFTPGGETSSLEIAQLKASLAEKEELLKYVHEKTADIICQKTKLCNQLQHLEMEREKLKSIVTQVLDIMRFVDKQTILGKELDDVMQQIKDKEELLQKAMESEKNVDELMKQHKQEMANLQQRIDALMAEKAKLEADLRKISVNNKLAEEQKRKLWKWEKQLAQFKKRMNEMKKLEKQKQQSEEMQKRMQAEIAALKQAKVRMVKQQKEEAEKYRQWKLKHDRELIQERKRDFEAAREKRAHDQQMLVCKQKLEEAKNV